MADKDSYDEIKDPVCRRMMRFFSLSSDAEKDNRERGLKAIKFKRGGKDQWDEKIYTARKEDNRPTESYNQIPQFVHQVTNDMRMNMPQTRFIPGNDGSKEIAEVYEDLARAIQASTEGEVAYDTASDNQVTIGWGYWRYIADYENDKSFDQVIKVLWIPNAFTVYDDPNATLQDFSDRTKLLEVSDVSLDDFNGQYKQKDAIMGKKPAYDSSQLSSIGDSFPDWANSDKTVRVAEFWEVTHKTSSLYRNKKTGAITKTKPKDINNFDVRTVSKPKVMWYKCTALEVLEKKEWPGIYIPYVRVSGETIYDDGKIYYSGLVEGMMAPQKQYNYWSNAATEMVALAPKAPYLIAVGQLEGLTQIWDNANVKNYPYLPYRPTDYKGQLVGAPQRANNNADIQSMLALVQQAQQNFYSTTGIYPPSLGKEGKESSGKAINARQKEGDVSTFHYQDNTVRGLRFGGRILVDLIPKVYDGSRTITTMKEDKTPKLVKINQKFEEDGEEKILDLTVGTYDVMITTGPSFTTKRQEALDFYQTLIQSDPRAMQIGGDIIVGTSDAPGADKLAERYKKTLPPGLADDPDMKNIPPEVQQQLVQSKTVIQQLQSQLQAGAQALMQAQQEVKDKQGDLQVKSQENEVKMQDIQANAQNDSMKADNDRLKIESDAQQKQAENEIESRKIDLQEEQLALDGLQLQFDIANARIQELSAPQQSTDSPSAAVNDNNDAMRAAEMELINRTLSGLGQSVEALIASIKAPKMVVRDPATGAIKAVVTS